MPKRPESDDARRKRMAREYACAELARMQASRPLKPPPGQIAARRATAGELAAAKDRRLGIIGTHGKFLESIEQ